MASASQLKPRDRDAIIQSLSAGVVPRRGLQYIQVGRAGEVGAILTDLDRIAGGGTAVRFVIGSFGSGKTFFLHLVRTAALEKSLVTVHADLNPDRRLHASGGEARGLYSELAANAATRTSPDGGAMRAIMERFIAGIAEDARRRNLSTSTVLQDRLSTLADAVGGYDFASVISAYARGFEAGEASLQDAAVRWMRGEYSTRTEARQELGVRTIVDDDNVYDQLKLFARFVVLAGYKGLLVEIDEMVNLYKLANTKARTGNYEQVLRIVNDCLQGNVSGLGFIFAGTPEFLTDPRRGLFSYEALESRLQESAFARPGITDFSGPVIRLLPLTPEEYFMLLNRLRDVYGPRPNGEPIIGDDGLQAFMETCHSRIGDAYFRTPRTTIRTFVQMLSILQQNPALQWQELLPNAPIEADRDLSTVLSDDGSDAADELTTLRL